MNTESIVYFSDNDAPEMQRAIKLARQTFRFFWRELSWERRRIVPGLDVACVKVAFSDPPESTGTGEESEVEQMWVSDVDFDGRLVSGTLINSPNWLQTVSEGDRVEIRPGQLTDWMYAIQGTAYGALTVNLIRSEMKKRERSKHDKAWGLDFGDPAQLRFVPSDFPGADIDASGNQNPAILAVNEHPMALNMCESLEEFAQDPANFTDADENGFTMLHQLALAGAAKAVSILLSHGADGNAVTKNGMTPLTLAKSLGWKPVVDVINAHAAS